MEKVSVMRLLRTKYGISAKELAEAAGVSQQHVSNIELGVYTGIYDYKKKNELLMQKAFEHVIEQRLTQARRLSEEFAGNRSRLLDFIDAAPPGTDKPSDSSTRSRVLNTEEHHEL